MREFLTNVAGAVHAVWLILVALFVIWPGISGAQSDALMGQFNRFKALWQQGKYAEAIPFAKRALELSEEEFGPDDPNTATFANTLARAYLDLGRYGEAEPLLKRSLAIREKALGPEHPDAATSLYSLPRLYDGQGRHGKALAEIRRATTIHAGRAARGGESKSSAGFAGQASVGFVFRDHVAIASRYAKEKPEERSELLAETFRVAQLARATSTAATVSRMGARFAAGSDALAEIVRRRQDTLERWRRLDAALFGAVSTAPEERDATAEENLRHQLADLDRRLAELDGKLADEFPEYSELANPRPIELADARALLGADEALVSYLASGGESYVWVVRRDQTGFSTIEISAEDLWDAVAELRSGLSRVEVLEDLPAFDTQLAHELYTKLLGPSEPFLGGVRHVFVVPDGALQSLPLGVLVSEEPQGEFEDLTEYSQTQWLARKYAVTVLPSVSSLRALHLFPARTRAAKPFIGYGDPLLDGGPGGGFEVAGLFARGGGVADVSKVRRLARLPETSEELEAMATALGAGTEMVHLGEEAREPLVRGNQSLADYRVVAFATHGLLAGDFEGIAEPALVLTPPKEASEEDDGLLVASEIAQLKLNADWVVLSAGNTAAADGTPGAEGLPGLAKAFFYAGSRALLVSHWPVETTSAQRLTTGAFRMIRTLAVRRPCAEQNWH